MLELHENVLKYHETASSQLNYSQHVESFHSKRALEYKLGRLCSHLAHLELTGKPLLKLESGEAREPLWPEGIVGSISHSKTHVCVAVALAKDVELLGIDLEIWPRVRKDLLGQVCTDEEFEKLSSEVYSEEELLTLIFSSKECLYKSLYPKVRKFFGFKAALVTEIVSDKTRTQGRIQIELIDSLSAEFGPGGVNIFHVNYSIGIGQVLCSLESPFSKV